MDNLDFDIDSFCRALNSEVTVQQAYDNMKPIRDALNTLEFFTLCVDFRIEVKRDFVITRLSKWLPTSFALWFGANLPEKFLPSWNTVLAQPAPN